VTKGEQHLRVLFDQYGANPYEYKLARSPRIRMIASVYNDPHSLMLLEFLRRKDHTILNLYRYLETVERTLTETGHTHLLMLHCQGSKNEIIRGQHTWDVGRKATKFLLSTVHALETAFLEFEVTDYWVRRRKEEETPPEDAAGPFYTFEEANSWVAQQNQKGQKDYVILLPNRSYQSPHL
jgi:hypothetical protein